MSQQCDPKQWAEDLLRRMRDAELVTHYEFTFSIQWCDIMVPTKHTFELTRLDEEDAWKEALRLCRSLGINRVVGIDLIAIAKRQYLAVPE